MPVFEYKAKDEAGQEVVSQVEASSRYEALTLLRERGLTVLQLAGGEELSAQKQSFATRLLPRVAPRAGPRPWQRAPRVSVAEKAVFMRQLAISVTSGVPLREALESLAEDLESAGFRRVAQNVVVRLREGSAFSEAVSAHPSVFSTLFVALLRVAEESGSMPQTLEYLAQALERGERLARKIRSIMAYPAFVAGFMLLVCVVMTVVVVPRFQAIFKSSPTRLPALTEAVFSINRFLLDHIGAIAVGAVGLVIAFVLAARSPAGRRRLDALKLRLPLFGPCLQKMAVARFCRNFAIMIRGGVPVASAMEIAASVSGNTVIESALRRAHAEVLRGSAIAAALSTGVAFPRLLIRMVSVGETTGRLPEVMEKVSDAYEEQVESAVVMTTALFEPIIIVFFGMIVLTLVLAVYLPVFTAASRM